MHSETEEAQSEAKCELIFDLVTLNGASRTSENDRARELLEALVERRSVSPIWAYERESLLLDLAQRPLALFLRF